ncbi:hypothetical protein E2C01_049468 [Portunus trituberculatus]|uniref:Uncharacterized protein n=1 Tax=Portunus trituberculatus TaxID=210409 RepID=A0A5B7GEH4_PORTR|nr:hypothetical protein [Portunus trituberculatus]
MTVFRDYHNLVQKPRETYDAGTDAASSKCHDKPPRNPDPPELLEVILAGRVASAYMGSRFQVHQPRPKTFSGVALLPSLPQVKRRWPSARCGPIVPRSGLRERLVHCTFRIPRHFFPPR